MLAMSYTVSAVTNGELGSYVNRPRPPSRATSPPASTPKTHPGNARFTTASSRTRYAAPNRPDSRLRPELENWAVDGIALSHSNAHTAFQPRTGSFSCTASRDSGYPCLREFRLFIRVQVSREY